MLRREIVGSLIPERAAMDAVLLSAPGCSGRKIALVQACLAPSVRIAGFGVEAPGSTRRHVPRNGLRATT